MNYSTTTKNIFGIDPGMANTGWSAVSRNRTGKFILLDSGCIRTPAGHTESVRLLQIYKQISELLNVHTPNAIAIERVFHNKNISSSLTTAAVMGVCQLASAQAGLDALLFTPQQVKAAVCGYGTAEKSAVKKFVEKLTGVPVKNAHAADAVATAIAGLLSS